MCRLVLAGIDLVYDARESNRDSRWPEDRAGGNWGIVEQFGVFGSWDAFRLEIFNRIGKSESVLAKI